MKNRSSEFILGLIFGVLIASVLYLSNTRLEAETFQRGTVSWKPLYVTIVED